MSRPQEPFIIVDWKEDGVLILDQRRLPNEEIYLKLDSVAEVAEAIKTLAVRGAPAIGVAGAFGVALAAQRSLATSVSALREELAVVGSFLNATRPTAVNLAWGIARMLRFCESRKESPLAELKSELVNEAIAIKNEDIAANRRMGEFGQELLRDGDTVLTHCNAGALATAGFGTAVGVVYAAVAHGKKIRVIADETRPLLQGARLTAWELKKSGVPVTVIADNMAGSLMRQGLVDKVIVGADRIAANGDTANKIGTYPLAICAKHHGIPFYVAAPFSTIDLATATGEAIPIEERAAEELMLWREHRTIPEDVSVRNPAFDVTPHELIAAIITERGVIVPPFHSGLMRLSGG